MTLSIRNQLPGTVTAVHPGQVMALVKIRLDGGQHLTAAITLEASEQLALAPGAAVHALVKSTEVSLSTGQVAGLSIRNRLPGTITGLTLGAVMAAVRIRVDDGELTAAITREAATDLGLFVGSDVIALIKSTEVSLATA
ncbi:MULTISPECIES: molybdopterin-binding protein [Streptomyces]|uniref:Molybdate transport system regulatory protein n=1 Tax=Streptomyces achromogenes TaxID=67255 RepID=A0ABU0PVR7_STRAH|nr:MULTISPECIES: TOBE domain-containing protein [Streptomyces]MDQ0682462.1 molybdate transport system regulatory protein [Streptomyces achromogenes]MDQ0829665.1 molybdate transport system regulatory protein [Streptomyces achromogenes]MDQ0963239.1 molybdate transport system regulatory protein [Streptomyces sp. B4I13]